MTAKILYAEMHASLDGSSHKVASTRLPPRLSEMVQTGEAKNEEVFGTEALPGPMRTKLLAFVPLKLFRDEVNIEFRIADQNGLPVVPKADKARAALEQAFSNPKER